MTDGYTGRYPRLPVVDDHPYYPPPSTPRLPTTAHLPILIYDSWVGGFGRFGSIHFFRTLPLLVSTTAWYTA